MTTLTETIVDVADRHTTLYYLAGGSRAGPVLPFGSKDDYVSLHEKISKERGLDYREAFKRESSAILKRLAAAYSRNKYWQRVLGDQYDLYPTMAWDNLLPVDCSLTRRVRCVLDPNVTFKVSPRPHVLLYPFGWSAWVSLRITGGHDIKGLAAFMTRLFEQPSFEFEDSPGAVTLQRLLDDIAKGVRGDAFGGDATADAAGLDKIVVTTVLAKHEGSPALGALGAEEQQELFRIIRPSGPLSRRPFEERVYRFLPRDHAEADLEYMIHDAHGRFLWIEHLLDPKDHNRSHLRCYEDNTFRSLLQAWHLQGLLDAAVRQPQPSPATFQLARAASERLKSPPYRSASLVEFLEHNDELQASLEKIGALKSPAARSRSRRATTKLKKRRG